MNFGPATITLFFLFSSVDVSFADDEQHACPWKLREFEETFRDSVSYNSELLNTESRMLKKNGKIEYTYCVYNTNSTAPAYAKWGDDADDLLFDLPVPAQKRVPQFFDSDIDPEATDQKFAYGRNERNLSDETELETNDELASRSSYVQLVAAPQGQLFGFEDIGTGEKISALLADAALVQDLVGKLKSGDAVGVRGGGCSFLP